MKRSIRIASILGLLLLGYGCGDTARKDPGGAGDAKHEYRRPDSTKKEYRENFKELPWKFGGGDFGQDQDIYSCTHEFLKDYKVALTKEKGLSPDEVLHIYDGDKTVFEFKGHRTTVFTRLGSTIYVADYYPISSGCSVIAFDLGTGKQLWRATLKGIGPIKHSKYFNRVAMSADHDVILVKGDESAGRYFELLDAKTGETIAHRIVDRKEK